MRFTDTTGQASVPSVAWHTRSAHEALEVLGSSEAGLTSAETAARLQHDGPNALPVPPSISAFEILTAQLKSVVVALLMAAVFVSIAMGDRVEALAIGAVLLINTAIGFLTERRARRAIDALTDFDVLRATVCRDGRLMTIDARGIVRGDVIEVVAGRLIPADGRLIDTHELRVDEAALTGESMPVSKAASATIDVQAPLAERATMVFKGTMAVTGVGRAVATATGSATEVGRIGTLTAAVRAEPTPLERQLQQLGTRLVWITLGVAGVVGMLGLVQGLPVGLVLQMSLALAIAAIPEALPAIATIALAVGVHRLARRKALVRYLPAVESLGSTTVICTDKTRTLTSGKMRVVRTWIAGDSGYEDFGDGPANDRCLALVRTAARASRPVTSSADADPVDAAMWDAAIQMGIGPDDIAAPTAIVPFSSDRKWMAAFHREGEALTVSVKGAPHALLALSTKYGGNPAGGTSIDDDQRAALVFANDALAREGLRVLAVATAAVESTSIDAIRDLTLIGFVGLADPPAPGVKETIARLHRAGLRTMMLTGDQRATAESVGHSLGLLSDASGAMDGRDLDALSDAELDTAVRTRTTFTRVTPEHKLMIVRALRRQGEIVAMLGDGINDAAALRQADVGVAMGVRGTDIAKQSSSVILQDDRFETIAAAVEEGRVIFDNIRRCVFYLFSCNAAEVLLLLCTGLLGLPLPLLPLQLLWLNLLTDTFPALALAVEPGDADVMTRPPRPPRATILSRAFIGETLAFAVLIAVPALAVFVWGATRSHAQATTFAFLTLGFAQVFHLVNARGSGSGLRSANLFSNPFALAGAAMAAGLLVLSVTIPGLRGLLHLANVSATDWGVLLAASLAPAIVGQTWKWLRPAADRRALGILSRP